MLLSLFRLLGQARDVFFALPTDRKVMLFLLVSGCAAGFIALFIWANKPQFTLLYSSLGQDEAAQIMTKLREKKIPYQLEAGGTSILVPAENVDEMRLEMAAEGLPRGGGVGMELFNKQSLSTTDFVQKLNYQRAIQGELERTIRTFPEIGQVRVHLNMPKESLFLEEARQPSASVVIKVAGHQTLTERQMLGIVNLVASSVEGLTTANVTLVDTSGGLLYKHENDQDGTLLTANQVQQRKVVEKTLAERVTTMLEQVLGPNKAVARVTAEMDFKKVSTTEESFDPDTVVVRSEQRVKESSRGASHKAGGVPSSRYDMGTQKPEADSAAETQPETYDRTEETTNYDMTRVNRQTVTPGGTLKRLSVAVVVDGTYTEKTEEGKAIKTYAPRTEAEMASLDKVVRHAIGYSEERGDTVAVTNLPFYTPEEEIGLAAEAAWMDWARKGVRPAVNVFLIVLFFLFVARPLIGWIRREARVVPKPAEMAAALPGAAQHEALPEPEKTLPEKVKEVLQQQPDRSLDVIQSWISES